MREALTYPIRGEHGEKTVVAAWICALLHSIALPVIALVPLVGYAATVLAAGRDAGPPAFLDRSLLGRSVGASALVVATGAVPLGMALVTFRLLVETDRTPEGGEVVLVLVGSTSVLVALAAFGYLLPIALANYAQRGSLRQSTIGLGAVARDASYFLAWSSGIVMLLVGVAAWNALADAGNVFVVAGSFVGAYATIVAARRIGRGYAAAVGR